MIILNKHLLNCTSYIYIFFKLTKKTCPRWLFIKKKFGRKQIHLKWYFKRTDSFSMSTLSEVIKFKSKVFFFYSFIFCVPMKSIQNELFAQNSVSKYCFCITVCQFFFQFPRSWVNWRFHVNNIKSFFCELKIKRFFLFLFYLNNS